MKKIIYGIFTVLSMINCASDVCGLRENDDRYIPVDHNAYDTIMANSTRTSVYIGKKEITPDDIDAALSLLDLDEHVHVGIVGKMINGTADALYKWFAKFKKGIGLSFINMDISPEIISVIEASENIDALCYDECTGYTREHLERMRDREVITLIDKKRF